MRASDEMTRNVRVASPDATIQRRDAGALPVGQGDRLIGVVTGRDLAVRGVAEDERPGAGVRKVMTPGPNT